MRSRIVTTVWVAGLVLSVTVGLATQEPARLPRSVTDPGVITTRQAITPAGVQTVFDGRVFGLTFGTTNDELWVLTRANRGGADLFRLDWLQNRIQNRWQLPGTPALQGLALDPVRKTPLVGVTIPARAANNRAGGAVQLLWQDGARFVPLAADLGRHLSGAPAVTSGDSRRAVVPLVFDNAVAVLDAATGRVAGTVKTGGVAPFAAVISSDGHSGWISNWGGRWPKDGDVTAPTGLAPTADRVVVDARGIASTGTITRVDLDRLEVTATVDVGLHPTAIAWDEARRRLYVANANSDSVSVVDTDAARVVLTIPLEPFGLKQKGFAPTALALAPGGATLFVALGGLNAVAVVDTRTHTLRGLIPTAWYPNHLAISADGSKLGVATLLGTGSGWQGQPQRRYVHTYRGTVSVLPVPDAAQLASYTTAVAENNHIVTAREEPAGGDPAARPLPVPARAGDPSLIEHVVYIIKENRTYDQVFGDLPRGNGDPSLALFGEAITPNHHKLATEFVLFDNFYATGGNSGDGHQWVTQANETSYALWPGYVGRSYPFDGTDPIAYANTGFLWDLAQGRGKTVKVYGEYAGRLPESEPTQRQRLLERWEKGEDFSKEWSVTAPIAPLNRILAKNYPPYSQAIPDVVRARILLKDIAQWQAAGTMPNLVFVQLPSDHARRDPNQSTPNAHLADNDLALGQIVEALRRRRSGRRWPSWWSRTTLRTASITWMGTGPWRWRSPPTCAAVRSIPRSTPTRAW